MRPWLAPGQPCQDWPLQDWPPGKDTSSVSLGETFHSLLFPVMGKQKVRNDRSLK